VPRYFTDRHAPFFSRFAAASNSASRARYCADVLPSKGEQIHIVGDLGIAKGELFHGYFERAGNYDYKRASGAAERLPNYEIRARANEDMGNDFIRLLKLNNQRLKGRASGPPFDEKLLEELAELHVRLEGEGWPVFKLD
jgi:hypothetical protein